MCTLLTLSWGSIISEDDAISQDGLYQVLASLERTRDCSSKVAYFLDNLLPTQTNPRKDTSE